MPRIIDSSIPQAGLGSAVPGIGRRRHRRRSVEAAKKADKFFFSNNDSSDEDHPPPHQQQEREEPHKRSRNMSSDSMELTSYSNPNENRHKASNMQSRNVQESSFSSHADQQEEEGSTNHPLQTTGTIPDHTLHSQQATNMQVEISHDTTDAGVHPSPHRRPETSHHAGLPTTTESTDNHDDNNDNHLQIALGFDTRIPTSLPGITSQDVAPDTASSSSETTTMFSLGNAVSRELLEFLRGTHQEHGSFSADTSSLNVSIKHGLDLLPDRFVSTSCSDEAEHSSPPTIYLQLEHPKTLRHKMGTFQGLVAPVFCQSAHDVESNKEMASAFSHTPLLSTKVLRPKSSWKLLETMISTLLDMQDTSSPSNEPAAKTPRWHMTLVTTDLALFYEASGIQEHQEHLVKFFESVQRQCAQILQVHILVMVTRSGATAGRPVQGPLEKGAPPLADHKLDLDQGRTVNGRSVAACVEQVQAEFQQLYQERQQTHPQACSLVTMQMIDMCQPSLQQIWHPWIELKLNGSKQKVLQCQVDLPETWDGAQTRLLLELHPHIWPSSPDTAPLLVSSFLQRCRADSKEPICLEPIRLCTLESVDASLLYGLPLTVMAGSSGDYPQQQQDEMQMLVQIFFQQLGGSKVMLLREKNPPDAKRSVSRKKPHLYVLMSKQRGCGILYRYASSSEILTVSPVPKDVSNISEEMTEHIQQALDCLPCDTIMDPFSV